MFGGKMKFFLPLFQPKRILNFLIAAVVVFILGFTFQQGRKMEKAQSENALLRAENHRLKAEHAQITALMAKNTQAHNAIKQTLTETEQQADELLKHRQDWRNQPLPTGIDRLLNP